MGDERLREAARAVVDAWVDDESGMATFDPDLIDALSEALDHRHDSDCACGRVEPFVFGPRGTARYVGVDVIEAEARRLGGGNHVHGAIPARHWRAAIEAAYHPDPAHVRPRDYRDGKGPVKS